MHCSCWRDSPSPDASVRPSPRFVPESNSSKKYMLLVLKSGNVKSYKRRVHSIGVLSLIIFYEIHATRLELVTFMSQGNASSHSTKMEAVCDFSRSIHVASHNTLLTTLGSSSACSDTNVTVLRLLVFEKRALLPDVNPRPWSSLVTGWL